MAIDWTPEQLAIFEHVADSGNGNLIVRARAGTGKTTVIMEAIKRATWYGSAILCAFNKRIADELQTRLAKMGAPKAEAKTLHSIGFSFLRSLGRLRVEGNREFTLAKTLCDYKDAVGVAKLAVKIKEIAPYADRQDAIDLAWKFDCLPDTESMLTIDNVADMALRVCKLSQENDGTVSFADMLYLPLVLGLVRPQWDLVVVDETQDMSPTQIALVKQCVKPGGRIVVVGDDRQAIYGFRGADENTIDNLKSELDADELTLTVTHRCPKLVVETAKRLVPDYVAADTAPEGEILTIDRNDLNSAVRPGSFVLSRKNAPLMTVCLSMLKQGIRAKIQGRDIGAQLSNLVKKLNGRSMPDFLAKLDTWRDKEITRARARGNGIGSNREDAVNDIADTLIALSEDVTGLAELDNRLKSLFDEAHSIDGSGFVVCSSVHKAKGLEADSVFVLADTLYPGGKRDVIEEQNIEYVAVTRSKKSLTWVLDTW